MKIIVCSRKTLNDQWKTNKTWFYNKNRFFITIAGIADNCEYPCPYLANPINPDKILRLMFDDITESEMDNPAVKAFDESSAKRIHEFIDIIKNIELKKQELYINCAAGISRSGAVGYCLNQYVNNNEMNAEDFKSFFEDNKQIQPNPMIKRILNKELFGEVDYNEIFK